MKDPAEPRPRISAATLLFRLVVVLGFLVLTAQLWRLQVVEFQQLRDTVVEQYTVFETIPPLRGVVYDRNGPRKESLLASNSPVFVVNLIPGFLPKGGEQQVYERLSGLIGVSPQVMREKVQARREEGHHYTPLPIKSNVDRVVALKIEESHLTLPGVTVSVGSSRRYQEGELLAHLLGYTSVISPTLLSPEEYQKKIKEERYTPNDRIGAGGLEEEYEAFLRGRPGRRAIQVDATGRPQRVIGEQPAQPGSSLVLTIDLELQRFVTQALREGLKESISGVAVVMNPRTGEVLALASLPTYDNNVFADDSRDDELAALLKDTSQPFFHRAASGLYPPGSTFKLISAMGALQEGLATRDTVIESRGVMYVPHDQNPNYRQPFPEWTASGLGKLNFVSAIANSSNIYFFYLGGGFEPEGFVGLGAERIARYARMFGYGAPTGIDLPDEASGTIPNDAWKQARLNERWVKGDTYNMAIGQGFVQATPLQVANVTNAIANGGVLLKPRLLKRVVDGDGRVVREVPPQIVRQAEISPQHLRVVIEGMESGFTSGRLLFDYRIPGLRVAGKTGTGEFAGDVNARGELPTHGWLTAFAPVEDPQISVTIFVERGSGSKDAGPIAAKILRHYFQIPQDLKPEPLPTPTPVLPPSAPTARPAQPAPALAPGARAQTGPAAATPEPTPEVEPTPQPTPEPTTVAPAAEPTRQRRANRTPAPAPTATPASAPPPPVAPTSQPAGQPTPAPAQPPAPPAPASDGGGSNGAANKPSAPAPTPSQR